MSIKKKRNPRKQTQKPPARILVDKKKYPGGIIPADRSKHAPNNSWGAPVYYKDEIFTCVDCSERGVWTAEQQWMYFEVWRKPIYGLPVRCRRCRAEQREAKRLHRERSLEGATKKKEGQKRET